MAVYTSVTRAEIAQLLENFSIGNLIAYQGVQEGIENTTLRLLLEQNNTINKQFILTIIEKSTNEKLIEVIQIHDLFVKKNLLVPTIIRDINHNPIQTIQKKSAIIQTLLPGKHITSPNQIHCTQIGVFLAKLRLSSSKKIKLSSWQYGPIWWKHCSNLLSEYLAIQDIQLIQKLTEEFAHAIENKNLPKSVIHGDLFVDNALFSNEKLSGVIDFHHGCYDYSLIDLAIAINSWCLNSRGKIDPSRFSAMIDGYEQHCQLSSDEKYCLPIFLKITALRFWLSRSIAWYFQNEVPEEQKKMPLEYYQIIMAYLEAEELTFLKS